jgi:MFS family permease
MFMAGGLVGYGMIIVTAAVFEWNQSVFYIYYIICVLIGAPWSIHYASPTDAEKRALERLNDPSSGPLREHEQVPGDADASTPIDAEDNGKSYWQRCYVDCYDASPMFRVVSIGTVVMSMGSAGMMFVLLILRDLAGVQDPVTQQVHLGLISMALMLTASITSVIIGAVGMRTDQRWFWMGIFIALNAVCEVLVPCCLLAPDVTQRLYILYGVACFKGIGFGGMYNLMQPITWEAIPDHWKSGVGSVARATAWISVTRSFGVGIGNFAGGFILDFSRAMYDENSLAANQKYPAAGYFILAGFCAVCGIFGGLMLNNAVNMAPESKSRQGSLAHLELLEERRPSSRAITNQG